MEMSGTFMLDVSCIRLTERACPTTPATPVVLYPRSPDDLGAPCGFIGRSFLTGISIYCRLAWVTASGLGWPHSILGVTQNSPGPGGHRTACVRLRYPGKMTHNPFAQFLRLQQHNRIFPRSSLKQTAGSEMRMAETMINAAWWPLDWRLDWRQDNSAREVAEITLNGRKFLATRQENNPYGLPYGLTELSFGAALVLFEDLMELRYYLTAIEQGMLPL